MLERLRIKNFKAWRDTGDIQLAPMTIFFGTNSSGKSSLTQLLLLLQQTAQSSDRRRVLHLGDRNATIDLGSFSDIIHGHDRSGQLEFELDWRTPIEIKDPRSTHPVASNLLSFRTAIQRLASGKLCVAHMNYRFAGGPDSIEIGMRRVADGGSNEYELTQTNYQPDNEELPLPPPSQFYGFPYEAIASYNNTHFLTDLNLALEHLLSRLYYVGPLREYPQRIYQWSGAEPDHVGDRGARAVEALLASVDRRLSHSTETSLEPIQWIVAWWLKHMNLIEDFEIRRIGNDASEWSVFVRAIGSRAEVRLTDVGFGVSQILPVIVECFYVKPNSTVIFEQPEIHLHPSVQADLADLLLEALNTQENGAPRNIQFIIESHSEHFLRRLQRRIAEGTYQRHLMDWTAPIGSSLRSHSRISQRGIVALSSTPPIPTIGARSKHHAKNLACRFCTCSTNDHEPRVRSISTHPPPRVAGTWAAARRQGARLRGGRRAARG